MHTDANGRCDRQPWPTSGARNVAEARGRRQVPGNSQDSGVLDAGRQIELCAHRAHGALSIGGFAVIQAPMLSKKHVTSHSTPEHKAAKQEVTR